MRGMYFKKTPRMKNPHQIEVRVIHCDGIHMVLVNLFSGQLDPFSKVLSSAKGKMPPP